MCQHYSLKSSEPNLNMARKGSKKNKAETAEEVETSEAETPTDVDADAAAEEAEAAEEVEAAEVVPPKSNRGRKTSEKAGKKKASRASESGKAAPKRIRRSNTISGIRKRALTRILRVAGVKRIKYDVYDEMRSILRHHIEEVVRNAVTFMKHDRRTTLQPEDLRLALESRGIRLAAGINKNAKTQSLKSCANRTKKSSSKPEGDAEAEKKKHRFKPGTVAQREISFYQKHSDCVFIPKKNFRELVREVGQDFSDKLRYADDMFDLFQLAMEQRLREICANANRIAHHAHRLGIIVEDIHLAREIMKDD